MDLIRMTCDLKRPRLGITVLKDSKIIVAVVPRTWFGKKVPDLVISNNTKIIALPDKFERTLIVKEHSNSQKLIEDLKKGFYTDISKSEKNRRKKEKRSVPKPKTWYRGKSLQSRSTNNNEVTDEDSTVKQNDDHSMAVGLFLLMWKYNSTSENKYEFLNQMSNFSLGGNSNLLFIGQFMLENMKRYMRELRRTYKEQTVQSVAVKGRIDLMRSAPNISSGIPLLTCRVDEFNIQSPHYSALMTALDTLSSLSVGDGQGYLDTLVNHLKKEARKLRGVFREIPALDKSRAIRVLSNSSLPPQLRRWKSIFGYAVDILKDNSGIENSDKVRGFTLPQIESSIIWENILHSQISKFGENVLDAEPPMINPWQQIGVEQQASKKPDIFFTVKKQEKSLEVILDAKYYIRENEKTQELDKKESSNSVMAHNNWQMLGYAITPLKQDQTWKENTSRIVLMGFPTLIDPGPVRVYTGGQEYELTNSLILDPVETGKARERPTPILQSLGIPFPSYKQLKDEFIDTTSLEEMDRNIVEKINSRIDELYEKHKDKLFPPSPP